MTVSQESQSRREAYTLQAGQTFLSAHDGWVTALDVDRQYSIVDGWRVFVHTPGHLFVMPARECVMIAS